VRPSPCFGTQAIKLMPMRILIHVKVHNMVAPCAHGFLYARMIVCFWAQGFAAFTISIALGQIIVSAIRPYQKHRQKN
jgi:hypothetical protein